MDMVMMTEPGGVCFFEDDVPGNIDIHSDKALVGNTVHVELMTTGERGSGWLTEGMFHGRHRWPMKAPLVGGEVHNCGENEAAGVGAQYASQIGYYIVINTSLLLTLCMVTQAYSFAGEGR